MEQRLSKAGRRDYVTLLASMIVVNGQVGAKGLTKLYEVFSLLGTPEGERLGLVETLVFGHDKLKNLPVPAEIMGDDEVRLALAKDAVFVGQLRQDIATKHAVANLLNQIKLSPEQSRVMSDWVTLENKILQRLGAGEEWMASANDAKEIVARAAAVGIPLSALYAAGITGFSAVGITSGLAAIGGYSGLTILGLNPMTAGIAGLIIAGVTVKKVADFAIGNANATAEAKAFREQIEQIRSVQKKAATRLAGDLPRYAASGRIWQFWRRAEGRRWLRSWGMRCYYLRASLRRHRSRMPNECGVVAHSEALQRSGFVRRSPSFGVAPRRSWQPNGVDDVSSKVRFGDCLEIDRAAVQ